MPIAKENVDVTSYIKKGGKLLEQNPKTTGSQVKLTMQNGIEHGDAQTELESIRGDLARITIGSGAGGAAVRELSEDLTLTSSDPRNLAITATAPGLSVILPDVSTLGADGVAFRFTVTGSYDVTVKDATGRVIGGNSGVIAVGKMRILILVDKDAGIWMSGDWVSGEVSAAESGGDTVTPGGKFVFSSAGIRGISLAQISTDNILVVYSASNVLMAVVLTISDTTISVGGPVTVDEANIEGSLSLSQISTGKFLAVYNSSSYGARDEAVVLTVSNTSIIVGGKTTLTSVSGNINLAKISSNKFILTCDVGGGSEAYVLTVSGTTIHSSGMSRFENGWVSVCPVQISMDKCLVVAYGTGGLQAVILDVSGTTINMGKPIVFNIINGRPESIVQVSTDKFLLVYSAGGLKATVLTVSDSTISLGNAVEICGSTVYSTDIAQISTDRYLVAYSRSSIDRSGESVVLTVSDETISVGETAFFGVVAVNLSLAQVSSDKFVVAYGDYENSHYGTAQVLSIV